MLQKATIHFLFSLGIRSGRRPKAPVERSFTHQTAQSSFRCGNSSKIRRLNVSKESCTPWLFLFENPSPLNFPASNLVGSITAHSSLWFPLYFLFLISFFPLSLSIRWPVTYGFSSFIDRSVPPFQLQRWRHRRWPRPFVVPLGAVQFQCPFLTFLKTNSFLDKIIISLAMETFEKRHADD